MKPLKALIFVFLGLLAFSLNAQNLGDVDAGIASFYGNSFYNKRTANNERLKRDRLTAAHKLLPFNTIVEVYNPKNKRSIIVRINDRGPYRKGRIIDLTEIGAKKLGIRKIGITKVVIKVLGFEREQMLIPYFKTILKTNPKFSRRYFQKTRLTTVKKYRLKKHIKHKKYLKPRPKTKAKTKTSIKPKPVKRNVKLTSKKVQNAVKRTSRSPQAK